MSLDEFEAAGSVASAAQEELDRRLFHLKTLYDVSADILGRHDVDQILRSFLLMSSGNFGVLEGFVALADDASPGACRFEAVGYSDDESDEALRAAQGLLEGWDGEEEPAAPLPLDEVERLAGIESAVRFSLGPRSHGLVGLGPKLVGDPYDAGDRELLTTLVNNLVVALKNARSYQQILGLNEELSARNLQLQAALRKVEILESVKASLSKFVPATVCSLIGKSPTGTLPESEECEVTVLFLDIQGYTRLCEQLDPGIVSAVIERCFSAFMDAIYANNGDVNETAGDGLMVLFHGQAEAANALNAVRAAVSVRERARGVQEEFRGLPQPLAINMGINSGTALLGAAKFESYTGSRWTYTARGLVTNVASRIGGLAKDGKIYASRATANLVKGRCALAPVGRFQVKNVSEEIEVFEL